MIAPLQIPQGQAWSAGADFAPLAQLGSVYRKAQEDQMRKQTLASLGHGGDVDAQTLLKSGDLSLATLGVQLQNRQAEDAWRRQEAARAQRNADRSYGLQERAARRADDPTPAGFQRQPDGTYAPLPGGPHDPAYLRTKGDRQNAPSGYQWNDPSNPSAGMTAIPGGPGEKVDAEVAGRLGLAKSFLGQLPSIKERVEAGEITGPIDAAQAWAGMGGPGEVRRQIDSGAEALLRMLTGAGMNLGEASDYVRRYRFSPTDNAKTVLSKLNQLERELNSVGETVGKGRGGWTSPSVTQPAPAKQDAQGFRAPPKLGELRDGYRFKGGNPGDPASWVKVSQ